MEQKTLKEWRKEKGIKATELAEKLGLSSTTIHHWESGTYELRQYMKMAIAYALDIPDWKMIRNVEPKDIMIKLKK